MADLYTLLAQYGLAITFASVLLARLGIPLPALLLASFIGWKWWQRRRFFRALRMARVTAADLRRMIADGMAPLVLDVRTPQARTQDGRRFPGAIEVDPSDPESALAGLSPDREVAVFCT